MRQATNPVHPKSPVLNRRRLLGGASLAAAAALAAVPAKASAPVWAPTAQGRELLRLIAIVQAETVKVAACTTADAEEAAIEVQGDAMQAVDNLGVAIVGREPKTPADVVDRAIFACWVCQPSGGHLISRMTDPTGGTTAFIVGVLALAGLTVGQCLADGDLVLEFA